MELLDTHDRWWQLKYFVMFTPIPGEKSSNLTCAYFSNGLVQPPTRELEILRFWTRGLLRSDSVRPQTFGVDFFQLHPASTGTTIAEIHNLEVGISER